MPWFHREPERDPLIDIVLQDPGEDEDSELQEDILNCLSGGSIDWSHLLHRSTQEESEE